MSTYVLDYSGQQINAKLGALGASIAANPTLLGNETFLTAIEINGTKYSIGGSGSSGISAIVISRSQLPFAQTAYSAGQMYYIIESGSLYVDILENSIQKRKRIYPVQAPQIQITISYNTGGHGTKASVTRTYNEGETGYALTASDLIALADYNGDRFYEWDKSIGDILTADTTITATWYSIEYTNITISFNMNNHGSEISSLNRSYETSTNGYQLIASDLPNSSATNWRFIGWKINNEGTTYTRSSSNLPKITENITLYAQWIEQVTYTVSYNITGNVSGHSGTKASVTHSGDIGFSQSLINDLSAPTSGNTPSGYRFDHWTIGSTSGTTATTSTKITSSVTLYAYWVKTKTITLTYSNNGHGSSTRTALNRTIDDDTTWSDSNVVDTSKRSYSLTSTELNTSSPSDNHYTLTGWSETSGGSKLNSLTITTDKIIYALWTAKSGVLYYWGVAVPASGSNNQYPDISTAILVSASTSPGNLGSTDNLKYQYPSSDIARTFIATDIDSTEYAWFITTKDLANGQYSFSNKSSSGGSYQSGGFTYMTTIQAPNERTLYVWRSTYSNLGANFYVQVDVS